MFFIAPYMTFQKRVWLCCFLSFRLIFIVSFLLLRIHVLCFAFFLFAFAIFCLPHNYPSLKVNNFSAKVISPFNRTQIIRQHSLSDLCKNTNEKFMKIKISVSQHSTRNETEKSPLSSTTSSHRVNETR